MSPSDRVPAPPGDPAPPSERLPAAGPEDLPTELGRVAAAPSPSSVAGADLPPGRPYEARRPLPRGTLLGRYLILDELGSGGMGVVYVAYDPELDRKVAIKLLRSARDGEGQLRLVREAQAMARLAHPNIVAVHDVGTYGDQVFVAMELIVGRSLSRWVADERPEWRRVLEIYRQAGAGLAAAHAAGLVHRDFKPDNALLGEDGRVRVLDFGLARTAAEAERTAFTATRAVGLPTAEGASPLAVPLTRADVVLGTPAFMAPEQLAGEPADPRTDQYAFAVALWWALFDAHPFGDSGALDLLERVRAGRRAEPPADAPVPAWVRRILERALARDPADRFPSLDAMLAALAADPRRRLRRRAAWAGAAALCGLAIWGVTVALRGGEGACRGFEARLAGVWDDGRRAAVERAFAATGTPFSTAVFHTVAAQLDAYADAWVAQGREACQATRRGSQSAALLDLRSGCLEQRRSELAALVDLFAAADAKLVERAVTASAGLSSLARCADAAALVARVPPPADPAQRLAVGELGQELARVRALRGAGRFREALAAATELEARVVATGFRPLVAGLAFEIGDLEQRLGNFRAAEARLHEGLWAAEAGRDAATAAESAAGLVTVVGRHLAQPEAGERWGRHAFALLEAMGGDDRLAGQVHQFLGNMYGTLGEQGKAAQSYGEALVLFERALGPRAPEVGRALNNLGTTYSERGQYAEARDYYQRALAVKEATVGGEHPDLATTINNLGIVLSMLGESAEALVQHQRALAIQERALGVEHPSVGLTLNNLGTVYEELGRFGEALAAERRALAIGERAYGADHPDLSYPLNSIGHTLLSQGQPRAAAEAFRRALALTELGRGPDHPQVAFALTGLGRALRDDGQPAAAVALLRRAVAIRERTEGGRELVAESRFVLAHALWDGGGRRSEALTAARAARDELRAAGDRPPSLAAEIAAWLAARGADGP